MNGTYGTYEFTFLDIYKSILHSYYLLYIYLILYSRICFQQEREQRKKIKSVLKTKHLILQIFYSIVYIVKSSEFTFIFFYYTFLYIILIYYTYLWNCFKTFTTNFSSQTCKLLMAKLIKTQTPLCKFERNAIMI